MAWPVSLRLELPAGLLRLRPLRLADEAPWRRLRTSNKAWLERWEATSPGAVSAQRPDFRKFIASLTAQAKAGESLPWGIELDGNLVGQVTVNSITYGSLRSGTIGYWISEHVAGRGLMPAAVALATDYCFWARKLHRIEVNICPGNAPSLRVVEKLGFRDEGVREKYLHINGKWADHRTFALVAADVPGGLLPSMRKA